MRDLIDFTNRTVLVVGGASGIGRATAREFATDGATVAIGDTNLDGAKDVVRELNHSYDTDAIAIETDVRSYDSCQSTVDRVLDKFGRIDVLVNTAAARGPLHSADLFVEKHPEMWEFEVGVTLIGVLNMTHCVLGPMIEQQRGVILHTSSITAKGMDPGRSVYAGAKSGIIAFSETLSKEVGRHNIRVNVVAPGITRTERSGAWLDANEDEIVESYPLGRLGTPEDNAYAFVFLASDAAEWITGETIDVNGGFPYSTRHVRPFE